MTIAGYIKANAADLVTMVRQKLQHVKDIQEHMPGIEKRYLLVNKADMVRTAGQHLVYPINMHLDVLFTGVNLHILCNSEVSETQQFMF